MSSGDPVVIRIFGNEFEAKVAKTALDAAGIDSGIRSDNCGGLHPALSMNRGVLLLVDSIDAKRAEQILSELTLTEYPL
jgi:hypothetical protein